MKKAALRKTYLEKRHQLNQEELIRRNALIKLRFFDFFHREQLQAIHVFLPIKKHKEVDVSGIIDELRIRKPSCQIIISKSNFATLEMESFLYTSETRLQENKWGIPEPIEAELFRDEDISMVLVLLLAFDLKGHRVGYGKGFYDRFLHKCRPDALKVGLSLESPIDEISDTQDYDVKLDFCVTPGEVYRF